MSATTQQAERRGKTQEMAKKLVSERQEMLLHYAHLAGLDPYTPDRTVDQELQEFCEAMVDYLAFVHFEIYDRIGSGEERRAAVISVAEEIYPRITEMTEMAVAFNDKYDENDHQLVLNHLSEDLSVLGEEIAVCMEQEDRLLAALIG